MTSPVLRKLKNGAPLSPSEERAFERACGDVRRVPAREDVIAEGDRPEDVHVVLDGFACRYKLLPGGGRQIMALLVPGDFCDLHVAVLGEMDHSIATLTDCEIAYIPEAEIRSLTRDSHALTLAFWWATLVDQAILREWLVNMGRRPADKQIAHLLCELLLRLQSVGRAGAGRVELPLTQVELADTVGLSSVHVNRVLQQLREEGLITWRGKTLTVHDVAGLQAFAEFDPNYLHLTPRRVSASDHTLSNDARNSPRAEP